MSPHCIFCRIGKGEVKDTELVYEDEGYVVFRDFRPASEHHLLVIPRRHVRGIRHLKEEDIPVIRELENIGKKLMEDQNIDPEETRLGFHWPLTSVSHLHLHLISPESQIGCLKGIEFSSYFFGSVDAAVKYIQEKSSKMEKKD